jgi:hypothetical protein
VRAGAAAHVRGLVVALTRHRSRLRCAQYLLLRRAAPARPRLAAAAPPSAPAWPRLRRVRRPSRRRRRRRRRLRRRCASRVRAGAHASGTADASHHTMSCSVARDAAMRVCAQRTQTPPPSRR